MLINIFKLLTVMNNICSFNMDDLVVQEILYLILFHFIDFFMIGNVMDVNCV